MTDDTRTVTLDTALLKRLRQQRGWTQDRLAEELKCTKKTVQNWEKGKPVYMKNARQLEELFGQSLTSDRSLETNFQIVTKPLSRDRDRIDLIDTVRRDWLQPFHSDSLATHRDILPDLTALVDVVDHPSADLPIRSKPPMEGSGTSFAHRSFLDFARTLLILGAPGAGKTTLMFQLADILVDEAELIETAPVPVIFFLSSWNVRRGRIGTWLVGELTRRYPLSLEKAYDWVHRGMIMPLLDGLDEVAPDHRERCLAAINEFLAEQSKSVGSVSTIICCRTATYNHLAMKLKIGGAIEIKSLHQEQVEAYFRRDSAELTGAAQALRDDPTLYYIIDNPLMLNVFVKACQHRPLMSQVTSGDKQQRYHWLFDAYIDETFDRRGLANDFRRDESIFWLARLASLLRENREKVFYLDSIQPSWLRSSAEVDRVVLIPLLIAGMSVGLLFGIGIWLTLDQEIPIFVGAFLGLAGPVAFWRFGYGDEIHTVETLSWSWSSFANRRKEIATGAMLFGAIFGLFSAIAVGPLLGISVGIFSSALFAIFFGIPGRTSSIRAVPNQRIRSSLINCLITGVLSTAAFSILFGLWLEPDASLAFGLSFGVVTALFNGGHACIQHGALRLALWQNQTTPMNYLNFLRFATKIAILRQVGGGFMFIHDLLEEHFAKKTPDQGQSAPKFGKTRVKSSDLE